MTFSIELEQESDGRWIADVGFGGSGRIPPPGRRANVSTLTEPAVPPR